MLLAEPASLHLIRLLVWAGLYLSLEEIYGLRPGEAYFELVQYEQALEHFERALALRSDSDAPSRIVRDAKWHIARTLRKLEQLELALKMQQDIANEAYAENASRPYIYDELSMLYAALGDLDRSRHFAEHKASLNKLWGLLC